MWPVDIQSEHQPPCAIIRWITVHGDNRTVTFGPDHWRRSYRRQQSERGVYDRYDVLDAYPEARMFRVRIVTRDALIDIAEALI